MSGADGSEGRHGPEGRRAVCAGCGCLCDDILLDVPTGGQGNARVDTECRLGREWFATRVFGRAPDARPPEIGGQPADLPAAAARAAELLRSARHPLVVGLERLTLEGQRRMVEVADRARATLGLAGSDEQGTRLSIHRDGGHFVTLGEIRERVDCLVLWFVEPHRTHPRLLERFCSGDTGEGRERTLVAVGPAAGDTDPDLAVPVGRRDSLRLLWLLRLLADDPEAPVRREDPLGGAAADMMDRVRGAGAGAWIYDGGGPDGRTDPVEAAGILRLLTALNEDAPWGGRPLAGEGNPAGAEAVTTWQTGYPGPVTFRGGVPRYDGGASSGVPAGVDAVLLAGGDPGTLPFPDRPPCVWLDTGEAADEAGGGDAGTADGDVAVRIPVLPAGAAGGDTLMRMDGVAVRSPGIPGAGGWPGVPARQALRAVLRELAAAEREEAAS